MKKAIVIGASSGIGKGIAQLLAANNYYVGITGRRTDLLKAFASTNRNCFVAKTIDVKDTITTPAKLTELVAELGGLDLIIISSGTGDFNEHLDFEIEKNTIATNILGFTCIADWAFNFFEKQQYGHLAAISSVGGLRGSRVAPAYNASKAYQISYLEGLRQKSKKLGIPIFITDIRPGFVDTAMAKGEGQFWVSSITKAAHQIINAINKKKQIVYITKRWKLIAIILRLIPNKIYDSL
jgi:short-subunit dehydrogenase